MPLHHTHIYTPPPQSCQRHKPKRGPWSKLPVLLKAFDLTKKANITKADFQTAFAKAKGKLRIKAN